MVFNEPLQYLIQDMKITGLTIIRNAVKNDYPVVESISSILPVVDEMIVAIDPGEDNTVQLIESIASPKIRIVHTIWDMTLRKGGQILAVETNKALTEVSADTDWVFYIQADEVIHEQYHPAILAAAKKYLDNRKVEGLLFKYLHFYGTYDYVGDSRKWYNCETRIIRNDLSITAYRDAQGFRKGETKLNVAAIEAYVFHYGWVRSPFQMKQKQKNVSRYWVEDGEALDAFLTSEDHYDFTEYDSLDNYKGTHPAVMIPRIKKQNWKLILDTGKKKMNFKNMFLYWFEKVTGKRLFTFSNHRIVG